MKERRVTGTGDYDIKELCEWQNFFLKDLIGGEVGWLRNVEFNENLGERPLHGIRK